MLTENWTKSTRSGGSGQCVQARLLPGGVEVGDTKDPEGATLRYTREEWMAFVEGVKAGEFDLPT